MDGVPEVTQYEIKPGDSYTYVFIIPLDQAGTFWYHAHTGLQHVDGLYGAIIIHRPATASQPAD